ncbi:MAG: hybrid sensor histidine kinase/response regulator [Bacteroidota bacterium]
MKERNNDFQKKILATFQVEATERVKIVIDGLLRLEKSDDPAEQGQIVEALFRETHSLKGAARAVSSSEIERVCGSLESIFSALKKGQAKQSAGLLDILHRAVDELVHLLSSVSSPPSSKDLTKVNAVTDALEKFLAGEVSGERETSSSSQLIIPAPDVAPEPVVLPEPGAFRPHETVRVAVAKLDSLMLQAEEMVSLKLAAVQRTADLQSSSHEFGSWKKKWARVYSDVHALQRSLEKNNRHGDRPQHGFDLPKFLDFMESSASFLRAFEQRLADVTKTSLRDQRSIALLVESLLDDAKKALMFPFSSLLEAFPKLVRDLARDQKKEVELVMSGVDIEIDRRILETLKDPLIHLMRNCIDHGIEPPEERRRKGKSPRGTITVSVSQKNGDKIEVSVSDDGVGIDPPKVRAAAVKNRILAESEASGMTDDEALLLIFQSGVSTSPMITDVSGRGLGLAIVRERVENLGGHVSLESVRGHGTTFRLVLPLTLATVRGLLVTLDEHQFVVPAAGVERVVRFHKEEVRTVENRETISHNGQVIALVQLSDILGLPRRSKGEDSTKALQAFLLNVLNRRIAFVVDVVLQEQEVLVKSLGPQLVRVRNIAGSTILGSGKVVPILNLADLVMSAVRLARSEQPRLTAEVTRETERRLSVLVVEDSITARTLLRSILETAGYTVTTAIDGIDALTQLRTGDFNIVVSDVDMPRMNGFDLTTRIRADKTFSELPVVLVTALESREDRERGVDVGANAYIVKSSFDQSNLLETIRRLI